jgi:hypothetical protein
MTSHSILSQPTYSNLDANFESIKADLINMIQNATKDEIIEGAIAQAAKGLAKYGITIDDNLTFPAKAYLMEELFDAFVYMSNMQIKE